MSLLERNTDIMNAEKVNLLILERSTADLKTTQDNDGTVVLEGVFTEIGVKNKNNRIYEEKEVLPHINELKEKIKDGKLLGELDHPKDFDISLSNVSHVIEDLNYDPAKKQVIGRIRLLNTSKGKEAQALVKDGIPLHISSRAAGTVDENNKVKIKKWFTYDLVADPGFHNAELSRVNESLGYDDENILIYRIEEKSETKETEKENDSKMVNEQEYVSAADFHKYSEYIGAELKKIKESANKDDNGNDQVMSKLVKYTESIAERVNQLTDYTNHLAEGINSSADENSELKESIEKVKNYGKYLAGELNTSILYTERVAEAADKGIQYSELIGEKLQNSIAHSDHIAEKLNQTIKFADHIAENSNHLIDFADYLKEHVEGSIGYTEHIANEINEGIKTGEFGKPLNESTQEVEETKEEAVTESLTYRDTISKSIDALLEKSNAAKAQPSGEIHFLNFLTESKKNEFESLDENQKSEVITAMNEGKPMSTIQTEQIWESVFSKKKAALDFIEDMPEKYKSKWENLTKGRQEQIIAESKFYPLNTAYQINNFWQTRDLRQSQVQLEKLNESKEVKTETTNQYAISEEQKSYLINKIKGNLGRY